MTNLSSPPSIDEDIHFYPSLPEDGSALRVSFNIADASVHIHSTEPEITVDDDQSPYDEVAANVSNKDDPTMAVLTFRSWFLGLVFTCVLSFINQFFWYRTSPLVIGVLVAQLLSHLLGKLLAKILPTRQWKIFRWTFSFNPGPFTVKEHCIITAMAGAAAVDQKEYPSIDRSIVLFRVRLMPLMFSLFNVYITNEQCIMQ